MQMFNGFTMGVFNPYKINFNPDVEGQSPDQESSDTNDTLKKIESIISDNSINNVEKTELNEAMNNAFFAQLDNYIKNNGEVSDNIKNSLVSVLDAYTNKNDGTYTNLAKLAKAIGLKENDGKWSKESQETTDNVPEKPTLNFTGNLNGITPVEGNKRSDNQGLSGGLSRNAPNEEETLSDDENLYRTIQTINTQLGEVETLLKNDKLSNDNTLIKTQKGLQLAQIVIDYTTTENVQVLQKFISENLNGQDKADFDSASKKEDSFDGKFGKGTLKGVNIILKKTDEYISGMKNYLNTIQKQEIEKINDPTDIKNIEKGKNITAEYLLQINNVTLPDGVSVNFADGEEAKLNTSGSQEIKLEIKLGEDTVKTITVKVNIEDTATKSTEDTEELTESTKSAEPLKFNEGTYRVMKDNSAIATKVGLPSSAIFYSTIKCEPVDSAQQTDVESGSQQIEFTEKTGVIDKTGDVEYYLRLPNHPDMIYKIKVDSSGCICPTARNITGNNVPVMFEGDSIPSCVNYLNNKLPSELQNKGIIIKWDGEDYIITMDGYKDYTTIEPMTIDGFWLRGEKSQTKTSLTGNLALLNFTNFLFNKQKLYDIDFVNDNPNLKFEDNKLMVRVNKKSNTTFDEKTGKIQRLGKRLPVNRAEFGIDGKNVTDDQLKKFVKYNNHEDWNDNWDKKRYNKNYRHVKLS